MKKLILQKLVKPLLVFLKKGTSPRKLALSVSAGFVIGLFPVIGVTTAMGFVVVFLARLNMVALQLVNYLVYPLQIIMIIPLIKLGSWVLQVDPIPYTLAEMKDLITHDTLEAVEKLWEASLLGIFAWLIFVVPVGVLVYFFSYFAFKKIRRQEE